MWLLNTDNVPRTPEKLSFKFYLTYPYWKLNECNYIQFAKLGLETLYPELEFWLPNFIFMLSVAYILYVLVSLASFKSSFSGTTS